MVISRTRLQINLRTPTPKPRSQHCRCSIAKTSLAFLVVCVILSPVSAAWSFRVWPHAVAAALTRPIPSVTSSLPAPAGTPVVICGAVDLWWWLWPSPAPVAPRVSGAACVAGGGRSAAVTVLCRWRRWAGCRAISTPPRSYRP